MRYSILNVSAGIWTKVKNNLPDVLIYIRGLMDLVINFIFGLYHYRDDVPQTKMPPVQKSYLMDSAVSVAEKIRNKEVTSEEVVQACIDRINAVNPMINAVVGSRYAEAIEEARAVDRLLAADSLTADDLDKKPFLGVPFTTKESNQCRGMKHTLGLVVRQNIIGTEDAEVIRLMKDAGAILLATTNVPELCMWIETGNNIYGQTTNPYNITRNAGGSTGGEAALLASAGSLMGIGTDYGGSVRMPAFFCGIFGHKPTTGLTPLRGVCLKTGQEGPAMSCVGPMSRHAEDLAPILKVIVGENIVKLPKLIDTVNVEDLRVMYMTESRDVLASPVSEDLRTVMDNAVRHLSTKSRHPVARLHIENMKYSFRLWRQRVSKEHSQGPPWSVVLADRKGEVSLWRELLKMATMRSDYTLISMMKMIEDEITRSENQEWTERTTESLRKELVDKLGDNGVLIYPSHPFPASYHHTSYFRYFGCGYTAIFNALNLPVTQVPLGLNASGMPVGVQVVAGPYQDHLCFAVAKELQRGLGGWVPPFKI